MARCIVAMAPCGCIRFASVVDDAVLRPDQKKIHERETFKAVKECLRSGYTVKTVDVEEARAARWSCPECKGAKEKTA